MCPDFFEFEARTEYQCLDDACHEHLAGCGQGAYTGSDMKGHACQSVGASFQLARVDANSELNPEQPYGLYAGAGKPDGAGWSVERDQEAITDSFHLIAAKTRNKLPYLGIVCL